MTATNRVNPVNRIKLPKGDSGTSIERLRLWLIDELRNGRFPNLRIPTVMSWYPEGSTKRAFSVFFTTSASSNWERKIIEIRCSSEDEMERLASSIGQSVGVVGHQLPHALELITSANARADAIVEEMADVL